MLLSFWLLTLTAVLVASAPLEMPISELTTSTIIDFFSANVEYSYFLRHIQRLGLIPQINRMANVTVFAPINLAFVDSEIADSDNLDSVLRYFSGEIFRVDSADHMVTVIDSMYAVKREKKEQLGKDNGQLREKKEGLENEEKEEIVHYFPLLVSHQNDPQDGQNLIINRVAEIVEADNFVKHQNSYIHGINRLLPSSPSMCELLMSKDMHSFNGHSVSFVGKMFRLLFTPQPINLALKKYLVPEDPFTSTCEQFLAHASTLFLPTDAYVNSSLLELERRYYTAILHGLDNPAFYPTIEAVHEIKLDAYALLLKLLLLDLVLESTLEKKSYPSIDRELLYEVSGNSSTSQITVNDVLTSLRGLTPLTFSDGLVHIFDRSADGSGNPADFFQALNVERAVIIPRKALYALHYSQMVSEFKFRKLSKLIGSEAHNQTILIDISDRDDVKEDDEILFRNFTEGEEWYGAGIKDIWKDDAKGVQIEDDDDELSTNTQIEQQFVFAESFTSRQQLSYRFLDTYVDMGSELSKAKPVYHAILNSKLCLKKKIGSCYKTKVWGALGDDGLSVSFNDEFRTGLPVLAANNNAIYFSNYDYEAPVSFKRTMAGLISDGVIRRHQDRFALNKDACLETLKYLDSYDLILLDENRHGYTAFLPCGNDVTENYLESAVRKNAWQRMGLVLIYLQSHPHEFKKVLEGLFLQDIVLTHSTKGLTGGEIETLSGTKVNVTQSFVDDEKVLLTLNHTQLSMALNSDVLFNQGVIQITEQVLLPADFRVPLKELLATTEEPDFPDTSFFRLLENFPALEHQLTLDLEDDFSAQDPPYSLFVPTPDSLHWKNITATYRHLDQLLQMHVLPNLQLQPLLDCISALPARAHDPDYTFHTNDTKLRFRCLINPASGKAYLTLIKPPGSAFSTFAKSQRVTILSHGCTRGSSNGSCVFLLDNPVIPNWLDVPENFLYVHIGWISVGIGIVIGVILFGFCSTTLVLCLSTTGKNKTHFPVQSRSQSSLLLPAESSYMRITSNEYMDAGNEYGYETDNDMMGDEELGPLLLKRSKQSKRGVYGSLSPMGTPSAPLMIDGENLKKALGRERNLPGLKI